MQDYKRKLIILIALVATLLFVESSLSVIIKYPNYSPYKSYRLHTILGEYNTLKWQFPYYTFLNVESGNQFHHLNNIGLPGSDVDTLQKNDAIFVLGSSFVEANQHDNNVIASAILQKTLKARGSTQQVISVGASGHDPFTSWFRFRFFENYFTPRKVLLVLDSPYEKWLLRYPQPLDFTLPPHFGEKIAPSNAEQVMSFLRTNSRFMNLLFQGYAKARNVEIERDKKAIEVPNNSQAGLTNALKSCLTEYHSYLENKLVVVSISGDKPYNNELNVFCEKQGISFYSFPEISSPANRINGIGHLNITGNAILGKALYTAISTRRDSK